MTFRRPWESAAPHVESSEGDDRPGLSTASIVPPASADPSPGDPEQPEEAAGWSASFPFSEVAQLRSQLASDSLDQDALDSIARQAAELRGSVVRLASEKLEAAEAEAAEIRRSALEEASKTRGDAARVMVARVEEAAAAADSMRAAAIDDARRAREQAGALVARAVEEVARMRGELLGLFTRAEEMSAALEAAERQLQELNADLSPRDSGDAGS